MKAKNIYLFLFVGLLLIGVSAVSFAAKAPIIVPINPVITHGVPEFKDADFNAKARVEDTKEGLRIITMEINELKPDCSYGVYLANPRNGDREYIGLFIPNEDGSVLHRFVVPSAYKAVDIYAMGQRDPGLQTFDLDQTWWSSWDYYTAPTCTASGKDIKILTLNLEGIK